MSTATQPPTTPGDGREAGHSDQVSFDDQAEVFEARAGLPDGVAHRVAEAVCDYAGVVPGDLIVEIGAGTGLIGQWLAKPFLRYLGLDSSAAMLAQFAPRLRQRPSAQLRHADANRPWPVDDGSARAIFGSRVFPLLDTDHVVAEANRVGHPTGAVLIHGATRRSPDSPQALARAKLHQLLTARGYAPRPTGQLRQRLLTQAAAAGGRILPRLTVAGWHRPVRPLQILENWRAKRSMGGLTPPRDVAAAILDELTDWATETFGEPAAAVSTEETYVIEGVQLRPLKEG